MWPGLRIRGAHRVGEEAGASLAELMFAMTAGLVILSATFHSLSYFQQQFMRHQRGVAQQQDLRLGLEVLEQELRLAGSGSFAITAQDSVEFSANLQGLSTMVTAAVGIGQTALPVEDGRGWDNRKTVAVCWMDRCETLTLARDGQRRLLTVAQPLSQAIPAGACVSLQNHIRYYSRRDDQGILRLMRQVDGGASVLVGDITEARFSYWDERGQVATEPALVKLVVVEVSLPGQGPRAIRAISLRT